MAETATIIDKIKKTVDGQEVVVYPVTSTKAVWNEDGYNIEEVVEGVEHAVHAGSTGSYVDPLPISAEKDGDGNVITETYATKAEAQEIAEDVSSLTNVITPTSTGITVADKISSKGIILGDETSSANDNNHVVWKDEYRTVWMGTENGAGGFYLWDSTYNKPVLYANGGEGDYTFAGTATKATCDSNGNNISSTYALKSTIGTTDISTIGDGTVTGAVSALNGGLAKLGIETHKPTIYSANFGTSSITLYRQGRIAFGNVYITAAQELSTTSGYALVATITDPSFYPSTTTLVRSALNSTVYGQIRATATLTPSTGVTYTNQIIIGFTTANVTSGAIISFPIIYMCNGD